MHPLPSFWALLSPGQKVPKLKLTMMDQRLRKLASPWRAEFKRSIPGGFHSHHAGERTGKEAGLMENRSVVLCSKLRRSVG